MAASREWLAHYTWEFVTAQNALLCQAKSALHRPTSDGHETTRTLWEERHPTIMTLDEAVDLCRQCHRLAPFCLYNGNTFAAIIRDVVGQLDLPPDQSYVVRSLAGHIVAGVASEVEVSEFQVFCRSLE